MPRPSQVIVDGKKICSSCKEMLPLSSFHGDSTRPSGYQSACRNCRDAKYGKGSRNSALKFKYGISADQYDTMYAEQEGRCLICNVHQDVLCVDHDHLTKVVRGLLCRECNFGLGKFADDPQRLMAAAAYLVAHSTR